MVNWIRDFFEAYPSQVGRYPVICISANVRWCAPAKILISVAPTHCGHERRRRFARRMKQLHFQPLLISKTSCELQQSTILGTAMGLLRTTVFPPPTPSGSRDPTNAIRWLRGILMFDFGSSFPFEVPPQTIASLVCVFQRTPGQPRCREPVDTSSTFPIGPRTEIKTS